MRLNSVHWSYVTYLGQNSRQEIKIGKKETKLLLCSHAIIAQSEKPKGSPDEGLESINSFSRRGECKATI